MIQRRGLLTGLFSALAAPAIVRAGLLMPVKTMLWTPPNPLQDWEPVAAYSLMFHWHATDGTLWRGIGDSWVKVAQIVPAEQFAAV